MTQNLRTTMLALGLAAIATAVVAAPANVSASGQFLVVDGVGAQGATLKVAGPGGYRLITNLAAGERATVDLMAVTGPKGERVAALAPGTYHYELAQPGSSPARGTFRYGSSIASPPDEIAGPSEEGDSSLDWITIQDSGDDGVTTFDLDSDGGTADLHWTMVNSSGALQFQSHEINGGNTAGDEEVQVAFSRDHDVGGIGIGTPIPLHALDVQSAIARINLFDTDGGSNWKLVNNAGKFMIGNDIGCGFLCTTIDPIVTIEDGAPTDSLYVNDTGAIGVGGVGSGTTDLTLTNTTGSGTTRLALSNSSAGANWIYANTGAGNFVVAKAGTGGNEFTVRERNHGVATLDVEGHVRGTSFKSTSSRALKTGFEGVDPQAVLETVTNLPVTRWRFKSEDEPVGHIGPVAEDFQSAFGLGDGKTIATVDADGVLFAAVQGLHFKLEGQLQQRDEEIAELRRINGELDERLQALEEQLRALTR